MLGRRIERVSERAFQKPESLRHLKCYFWSPPGPSSVSVLILFVAPLPWHRSVISVSKAEFRVASRWVWNDICQLISQSSDPPPPTFSLGLGVAEERDGFWTWNQTERNWTGTGRRGCVSFCFLFVNSKASRCSRMSSDSKDQQHVPRGRPVWEASANASQKAMTQWAFRLSQRH